MLSFEEMLAAYRATYPEREARRRAEEYMKIQATFYRKVLKKPENAK